DGPDMTGGRPRREWSRGRRVRRGRRGVLVAALVTAICAAPMFVVTAVGFAMTPMLIGGTSCVPVPIASSNAVSSDVASAMMPAAAGTTASADDRDDALVVTSASGMEVPLEAEHLQHATGMITAARALGAPDRALLVM